MYCNLKLNPISPLQMKITREERNHEGTQALWLRKRLKLFPIRPQELLRRERRLSVPRRSQNPQARNPLLNPSRRSAKKFLTTINRCVLLFKFPRHLYLTNAFKQQEEQSAEGAKHFSKRSSIRGVALAVWKVVCVAWAKASKLGKRKAG